MHMIKFYERIIILLFLGTLHKVRFTIEYIVYKSTQIKYYSYSKFKLYFDVIKKNLLSLLWPSLLSGQLLFAR